MSGGVWWATNTGTNTAQNQSSLPKEPVAETLKLELSGLCALHRAQIPHLTTRIPQHVGDAVCLDGMVALVVEQCAHEGGACWVLRTVSCWVSKQCQQTGLTIQEPTGHHGLWVHERPFAAFAGS